MHSQTLRSFFSLSTASRVRRAVGFVFCLTLLTLGVFATAGPAKASLSITRFYWNPNPATSGQTSSLNVQLSGPAPAGGAVLKLYINNAYFNTFTVPQGYSSAYRAFSIATVSVQTAYTWTGVLGNQAVLTTLTVVPNNIAYRGTTGYASDDFGAGNFSYTVYTNGVLSGTLSDTTFGNTYPVSGSVILTGPTAGGASLSFTNRYGTRFVANGQTGSTGVATFLVTNPSVTSQYGYLYIEPFYY